eukprot:Skav210133  [mRNA]  locus=scaffold1493:2514:4893:+ [translate_table: standard]
MADPNFYEICPHLAHGLTGRVTHFVSWCWAYRLEDVVTAVARWQEKSSQRAEHIFLWMCFFCNNQYRIMDQAVATGSEDLKDIFEGHLVAAGQMLVLLDRITIDVLSRAVEEVNVRHARAGSEQDEAVPSTDEE